MVGLMPHPERACDALTASTDGMGLLESLVVAADPALPPGRPDSGSLAGRRGFSVTPVRLMPARCRTAALTPAARQAL